MLQLWLDDSLWTTTPDPLTGSGVVVLAASLGYISLHTIP